MEVDPFHCIYFNISQIIFNGFDIESILSLSVTIILLLCSGLISGSEVAVFSLSPSDIQSLKKEETGKSLLLLKQISKPERLLATILIANNFVNIGIVILSDYLTNSIFDFSLSPRIGFIVQVFLITFLLLLFGEIIPKVYAAQHSLKFSKFMCVPLNVFDKIFAPLSAILVRTTNIVNKRLSKKTNISIDDLSEALELTSDEINVEKEMLEGIVNFGNVNAAEIMKSRIDVTAVDIRTSFKELKTVILESGYSRIPVFDKTFDNLKGILYVKDLLPHSYKSENFKWQTLVRPPYYVPETKKINDLLEEFQTQKKHMAIIVDEYGGSAGIVTLEDILEEIVGDILEEGDEVETHYFIDKDGSYVFEGKILLNDFFKIIDIEPSLFDEIKGDADTLAGLILEHKGEIPKKKEEFKFNGNTFIIESVDNRRIKQIRFIQE
ncbi:MAG: gliding motility-associated protein GldE [Marinifilaceae bacterium]|nr:gliding motility-associated protein GldE [Marinifilaceae bacterium]